MKYFDSDMSPQEVRKRYRELAAKLHPDVGGDEEEFKILADEYVKIKKNAIIDIYANLKEVTEVGEAVANELAQLLKDVYPRLSFFIWHGLGEVEVEIDGNVPLKKILHIVEMCEQLKPSRLKIFCSFTRENLKKRVNAYAYRGNVFINYGTNATPALEEGKCIYNGRRYCVTQTKTQVLCYDSTAQKYYVMKRSPKLNFLEMMGLESKNPVSK